MATCYPCEQNHEKVNLFSLETLPNEIILNIFTHLTIKDLRSCAQVSKNFHAIRYDKTLWRKILFTSTTQLEFYGPLLDYKTYTMLHTMPNSFLVEALSRGARYLGFYNVSFNSTSQPNFPPTNQVEYLALSGSFLDENYFKELILSCHNLIKLSVANPCTAWKSDDLKEGILQNCNTLKVLDLSENHKLNSQDIKLILSKCPNLTEANFSYNLWHELEPNLSGIFESFEPNIEKLGLSGAALSINAITILLTQCNKLTDLDIAWAHLVEEPETRNIEFPTKTQLKYLYMRGFDLDFSYLNILIQSCENSLQVLDISHCKNTAPLAIELIVTKCLYLTAVDFCGLNHAAFICKNLTPNIEKVGLSTTDVSNEDIKRLVRRCNKIKELDISNTEIVINQVVDEIILHLSSTLEKLSLPEDYSPYHFPLLQLGYMPKLKYLWSFVRYGKERILDVWKKQYPNVVLSCHNNFSCQSHCDYTLYCEIPADVEYTHHRIVPNPNIAKAMIADEKIWEIPCQSIKLSELQDVTENKTVTNIPLISGLPTPTAVMEAVKSFSRLGLELATDGTQNDHIRLRGLPYEAEVEDIIEFLGDHSQSIVYRGVHLVHNAQVIDFLKISFLYHHDFYDYIFFLQ